MKLKYWKQRAGLLSLCFEDQFTPWRCQIHTPLTSGKDQVGLDALPQYDYGLISPCQHSLQACHAILLWAWQINHSQKLRQSHQVALTLRGWLMWFLLLNFLQNLSLTSKFSVTFPWQGNHNAFLTCSVMECAPERWTEATNMLW